MKQLLLNYQDIECLNNIVRPKWWIPGSCSSVGESLRFYFMDFCRILTTNMITEQKKQVVSKTTCEFVYIPFSWSHKTCGTAGDTTAHATGFLWQGATSWTHTSCVCNLIPRYVAGKPELLQNPKVFRSIALSVLIPLQPVFLIGHRSAKTKRSACQMYRDAQRTAFWGSLLLVTNQSRSFDHLGSKESCRRFITLVDFLSLTQSASRSSTELLVGWWVMRMWPLWCLRSRFYWSE